MSSPSVSSPLEGTLRSQLDLRTEANRQFFASHADQLARLCHRMAERFARGGRLIALGCSPAARSDASHVAVEFVHPVIVGKRALPAIGLTGVGGSLITEADLLVRTDDITLAFGADEDGGQAARATRMARARGALTVSFAPADAEWVLQPSVGDPYVRQELVETLYHVLWELVHVFFEHQGLLAGRTARRTHDSGASGFLYPFLEQGEDDLEGVIADVRRSALMKAEEVAAARGQTLSENEHALHGAAAELRRRFEQGGVLLALGNGGSATDATDLVVDFRDQAAGRQSRPAIDLTEDSAILTAIANDIGPEAIFLRQVIAYGHRGDALVVLSTSGNSANVLEALAEARHRGLLTIAMVGYDGGRIEAEQLADHVVVTRSEHIPRIQEAQASAYHVLRELVG